MIFITVGSQKFQFNRLLEEVDDLISLRILSGENVFAQTGYSTYKPVGYAYKSFLSNEEFLEAMENSEIIVSHGGTGSLINGIKKGIRVIGVPRKVEFGEHVDNHQVEIIKQFSNSNLILGISNPAELKDALIRIKTLDFKEYKSNTKNIINIIENFLAK
ncbi:beta(1,3)galactosyltransferase EpsH [Bacillus sp. FJAT-27225]|uniref:PssE/Cps14G family polysaccharide biosynthesis glycosyltransferase n=1 Tax=Bacillus sp. FJAT-27225 TaxID=1743144 RepID=UPI00080C2B05|nr:PssE/Cps14G family polysaccharide biosynthesis glycosyltransferase [Bacillus sp. FJAT-27225]OCA87893.1 beta(1,3)galactosyltransferase EpsH [Bacillus sp. FJAT-27225]